jgi:hypothetical protein
MFVYVFENQKYGWNVELANYFFEISLNRDLWG